MIDENNIPPEWQPLLAEHKRRIAAGRAMGGEEKLSQRNAQTPYSILPVIELLADDASFFEFQPRFGKSMVTRFARLASHAVALVANQPSVMAGAINADAAEKTVRLLDIASAFHVPVIFLVDNPGIFSGSQAKREGSLRAAAKLYTAQARFSSSKLHITLRQAFGFGSSLMAMNPFDSQTIALALPGISLGGMPVAGGGEAAKLDQAISDEISEAQNSGAWSSGDSLAHDEIIDPRQLCEALVSALQLSLNRRTEAAVPVKLTGIRP